jgi:hypothetical protein
MLRDAGSAVADPALGPMGQRAGSSHLGKMMVGGRGPPTRSHHASVPGNAAHDPASVATAPPGSTVQLPVRGAPREYRRTELLDQSLGCSVTFAASSAVKHESRNDWGLAHLQSAGPATLAFASPVACLLLLQRPVMPAIAIVCASLLPGHATKRVAQ